MQGKVKPVISPKPKIQPGSALSYRPGRPLVRTLAVKRQSQKPWTAQDEEEDNKQRYVSASTWSTFVLFLHTLHRDAATMPAVGILKKPPHPDPPPTLDRVKPPRPPKPKRGIPPPPPRVLEATRSKDAHPADEDEPTTEESYDYKDIDFASDIFDWRIPPPRPKPPRLQANGVAHKVSDSVPVVVSQTPAVAFDTSPSAVEQRLEPVDEEERNRAEPATEAGETGALADKRDKLAVFLAEHEGKELTMEDVRQLELLLDEAEGVVREHEYDQDHDHISEGTDDAYVKDDAGSQEYDGEADESSTVMQTCNGDGMRHNGEPHSTGKVRFSDENCSGDLRGEIPDEDPVRHADYGIMQFFHAGGKKGKKSSKAKDSGMYEPVGRQDLRFVRPDMSGYKPPEPSDVGDPFSWRRRDKRHQYLIGYGEADRSEEPTLAMDKILDGCQEVEDMIKARDLTPPGMLFDSLGRKKRVRKVRPPSPPPRPPPPVPPKLRTPSPLPPIPTEEEPKTTEDLDDTQMDEERQLELEKQILTDMSFVDALGSVSVKEEVLVAGSLGDGGRDLTAVPGADIEDLIVPMDATSYLTGDVLPPSDAVAADDQHDGTDDAMETEEVRQVAPVRVSRRDTARRRPPRPAPPCILAKPIPPERRKRVASAEPPLTAFERSAPPRNKAKRSVSFHTAEEIRKRIDVQAQNYLRTPRRKDRLSCVYMETSPSASAALNYGSLRRDHRRPLTPVYSHVNKESPRRKETGVQTNGDDDTDANSLPPVLPPKMRDVETMSIGTGEGHRTPEPGELHAQESAELVFGDSEIPAEFVNDETPVTEADKTPVTEADKTPVTEADKNPEVAEDSFVPQDFLALSKTPKENHQDEQTTESDSKLTTGSGRPLPPPPAPPRHRGVKPKPVTFDGPVVICGIVPKGEEGKMSVLSDLKVLRLSVVQLDASMIRVGQIEAEHMVARRLDAPDPDRTPTPSSQPPPDPDAGQGKKMLPAGDDDQANANNNNNAETPPDQKQTPEDTPQRLRAPQPHDAAYIRVASPVEGFNVWDGEYMHDRVECASPTNTMTSTTSGSASYVTCDETLHEGSDVTADGLDVGAADDDFGFGLDEDDDIDGRGTGCSTPTEMDATLGSDIPLAALLDARLTPIFAPPSEPYLPPPVAVHPHLPMDTDTDENFNSFGDDSRDPSNTVGI